MSTIKLTTLPSGLRILTDSAADVQSVALGIWAGVGARHETRAHNGAAHMVEHMLFKGTKTRNARQIVEVIENAGGHMNAYTSRDMTSYHVHLLAEDAPLALDVLADMYMNSVLSEKEVEREREVILQEIGMCQDTPDDLIFDNYYEAAYPDQAFGAPILGTSEIIASMPRAALVDHVKAHYHCGNTVISAAGNIDHDTFVAEVQDKLAALPEGSRVQETPADYQGGEHRQDKELEQSHIIIGFQAPGRLDEGFYAAQAFSNILGGGMSSRLFQEVREKRGLVYSIFSFFSGMADDGQFGIYAGTGPDKLKELIPVICEEMQKAAHSLKEEELERTKSQMKASLLIGRESMSRRADQQAKYLLYNDKALSMEHIVRRIEALSIADLQNVAQNLLRSKPTLAALGPLSALESYDDVTKKLAA